MPSCNASFFVWHGEWYLLARETNYTFRQWMGKKAAAGWPIVQGWPARQRCYSNEVLYRLEGDAARQVGYLSYVPEADRHRLKYIGYEDMRFMAWGGDLQCSFTVVDNDHSFTMGHAPVIEGPDGLPALGDVVKVPTRCRVEKNWQPIEGHPHQYIYSLEPYRVIDMRTGEIRDAGKGTQLELRGSSPVIRYRDGYICMAHINNWPRVKSYVHVLVAFDSDMQVTQVSQPFAFLGAPVEFCTWIGGHDGGLEVLFSVHDQLLYRTVFPQALVAGLLEGRCNDGTVSPTLYEELYRDAIENGNYKTAAAVATFAGSRAIREEAATLVPGLHGVDPENRASLIRQLRAGTSLPRLYLP